jgi:hypothetical protein
MVGDAPITAPVTPENGEGQKLTSAGGFTPRRMAGRFKDEVGHAVSGLREGVGHAVVGVQGGRAVAKEAAKAYIKGIMRRDKEKGAGGKGDGQMLV